MSSLSPKMWCFMGSWNISAFIICVLAWLISNPQVLEKCISVSLWPSKDISLARKSREFLALRVLTHSLFLFIVSSGISSGLVGRKKSSQWQLLVFCCCLPGVLNPKIFSLLNSIVFLINQGQLFFFLAWPLVVTPMFLLISLIYLLHSQPGLQSVEDWK